MKRISILLCFLISSIISFGQFGGITPLGGTNNTISEPPGAIRGKLATLLTPYADTVLANNGKTNFYGGSAFYNTTTQSIWFRNSSKWVEISPVSAICPLAMNGSATWSGTGYTYHVTALNYNFPVNSCQFYNTVAQDITLTQAGSSQDRWDVIYADINQQVGILTGTLGSGIPEPVNPFTQRIVATIFVQAGSTVPSGTSSTIVYNTGTEWGGSSNATANFFYATNPCVAPLSTLITNPTDGQYVQWQNGVSLPVNNNITFTYQVRLNSAVTAPAVSYMTVTLFDGATQTSQPYQVANGSYGFNSATLNTCEQITIPISGTFNIPTFDRVKITFAGLSATQLQIDYAVFTFGTSPPPVSSNAFLVGGQNLVGVANPYLGSNDYADVIFGANSTPWLVIDKNGIQQSSDTTKAVLKLDRSTHKLYWDYTPTILADSPNYIYTSAFKDHIATDTNYLHPNALVNYAYLNSHGIGTTPSLQQVTAVDSVTTHAIYIDSVNGTRTNAYFFGNSITEGFGLPSHRFRYSTLLSNYYGYTETNFGLSGSYLEKRVPIDPTGVANMVDRIPLIPAYTTGSLLVFMYGINDINFVSANYNPTNYVADYTTVLNAALAQGWVASNILLITPTYVSPTSYQSVLGNPAATPARHNSFDSCVQVLATTFGTHFFNSDTWMAANGGRSLFNASDSLHPNVQGHNVIFNGIVNALGFNVLPNGQHFLVNGEADFNLMKYNTTKTTNTKYNILATDSTGTISKVLNQVVVLDTLSKLNLGTDTAGTYQYNFYGGVTYAANSLVVNTMTTTGATQPNKYLQGLFVTGKGYWDAFTSSNVGAPLLLNSLSGAVVGVGTATPTSTTTMSIAGSGTTSINLGKGYGGEYNGIWLNGLNSTTNYNLLSGGAADFNLYLNRPTGYDMIFAENNVLSGTPNMAIKSGGFIGMGIDPATSARLLLRAGSTSVSPLRFTAGAPTTTLVGGNFMYNNGLFIIDSSASKRDTIATRSWVASQPASGGSPLFPLTGTGTATGDVVGDLNGNNVGIMNGKVGIGTSMPDSLLTVNGAIKSKSLTSDSIYSHNNDLLMDLTDPSFVGVVKFPGYIQTQTIAGVIDDIDINLDLGYLSAQPLGSSYNMGNVDWKHRVLKDSNTAVQLLTQGLVSLDWQDRKLVGTDGTTSILSWETGKVGIGNTSPDSLLHVSGGGHFTGGLRADNLLNNVGTKSVRYNPGTGNFSYADSAITSNFFSRSGDSTSYTWYPNQTVLTPIPANGITEYDSSGRLHVKTSLGKIYSISTSLITANTSVIDSLPNFGGIFVMEKGTQTLTNKTISGSSNTFTNIPLTTAITGVLPVANGGTNASSAGITAFNNITGYTAAGATGTTSTNLVFSTSPTIITPSITTGFTIGGAAASGKFIVGNGTNYVASTSTIPTSAGATANKLLLSDGTNYVLSTPTFPNASATSRKIIVSDGTNWTASTETWPIATTSGNIMQSDGTNWVSVTLASNSQTVGGFNAVFTGNGRFATATVGTGSSTPTTSSILDIGGTTKGVLFPRLTTTQQNAITTPATGLEIFNTTTNTKTFYNGTQWATVTPLSGSFSGVGTATTVFTVTIGSTQPNATYKINVTPTSALSAALFYVTNKTTTTFDVTYLAGLTGTVTFDYTLVN